MGNRLENKVALITGSTSGIGRASAERFAEEGATVVINGRREALGHEVVQGIIAAGGSASFCPGDITDMDAVRGLVQYTLDTYGRIDILMNNAFSGTNRAVTEMLDEEWDRAYTVIIKAAAVACKAAIPAMIAQGGGAILNTASVHGVLAGTRNAPYNTFKAGLINLTRQMAVDYGIHNIRANALCPGRIVTESKIDFLDTHPEQKVLQTLVYPLGRPGTMREAANAALFLVSDEASFVTGHALLVDGGLTAQLTDSAVATVEADLRQRWGVDPY